MGLALRAIIAVCVVAAMVASGLVAPPATTFILGGAAILWLMLTFDAERPEPR